MIIGEDLLMAHGAVLDRCELNQTIFKEGGTAKFYFQVAGGTVELKNYHEDGKEFIQSIVKQGQAFGEASLFNGKPYAMSAVAGKDCRLLKLSKQDFFNLLQTHPELHLNLLNSLADRLYEKSVRLFNISSQNPIFKIQNLIDYLKGTDPSRDKFSFQVPLTRQQLANLTGLRVETVIRSIKKMENQHLLKIEHGKIYY